MVKLDFKHPPEVVENLKFHESSSEARVFLTLGVQKQVKRSFMFRTMFDLCIFNFNVCTLFCSHRIVMFCLS